MDRSNQPDSDQPSTLVATEALAQRILVVRGHRVMLDADLAALYGVLPKRLNEQVRRNHARFPPDFMFQLTLEEADVLRSRDLKTRPWRPPVPTLCLHQARRGHARRRAEQ